MLLTAASQLLLAEVLGLAQQLHFTVVAEGVETPTQAQLLREAGCQLLQGFLYSKAVPAAELGQLLAQGHRWS